MSVFIHFRNSITVWMFRPLFDTLLYVSDVVQQGTEVGFVVNKETWLSIPCILILHSNIWIVTYWVLKSVLCPLNENHQREVKFFLTSHVRTYVDHRLMSLLADVGLHGIRTAPNMIHPEIGCLDAFQINSEPCLILNTWTFGIYLNFCCVLSPFFRLFLYQQVLYELLTGHRHWADHWAKLHETPVYLLPPRLLHTDPENGSMWISTQVNCINHVYVHRQVLHRTCKQTR